ncbi:MAG TPA: ATP-binding cassette domain-containing protein [Acidimicrobiales bacterium]|nr:ATP-binding cassette domain-containing protein [Acidimicrobiales bacterium]
MTDSAIRVEGLHKRFGDVVALDGVDLNVAPGTVYGLLGPNGAGKTTTVRILTTILQADEGHASVLGFDVTREPVTVRRLIGLTGQFAAIDGNLTGRENLRLVGKLTQLPKAEVVARAGELLDRFGLTDAGDRPARTYSGGMRRRLDVAAALVHKPPVLFLDEPTTGLDPQSRNDLWEMIRELVAEGTTVLLTTQYLEEADRLAERIAVIDGGKVIAEGTPVELKARLGSTVVEIGLETQAAAIAAEAALSHLDGDGVQREDTVVRLKADDGAKTVMDALRTLDAQGLAATTLALRDPSLDDVFLALTGRHAEPGDAASTNDRQRGAA